MKRQLLWIIFSLLLLVSLVPEQVVQADTVPTLLISQFKITSSNGQSFTLYNASANTLDMSKYELEYFNSYDLSKATSSKLITLTGSLAPHGYYIVNDDSLLLCYQQMVDSVSLGLSSTAGLVEVLGLSQSGAGGSVATTLQDYVAWSKTAASGAQTLSTSTSASLRRLPLDNQNNPIVGAAGAGSWQAVQPSNTNPCQLVTVTGNAAVTPPTTNQLLPATEPPATIIEAVVTAGNTAALPAADIGLMAPTITELLPNPNGTGTDSTDEYVELYNPNAAVFDLNGFVLQAGTTVLHTYIFPAGASLPAQSFGAFYSEQTGLSLSNSGGQAKLLDPLGNTISTTQTYATADDGQAWALAHGNWYWTTTATPNAANVIKQPVSSSKAKATSSKSAAGKVKAAKTTKSSASATPFKSASAASNTNPTPVHAWTLALVAGLALLYGAYEYRADLGNYFHKLRHYRATRRADRT